MFRCLGTGLGWTQEAEYSRSCCRVRMGSCGTDRKTRTRRRNHIYQTHIQPLTTELSASNLTFGKKIMIKYG